MGIGKFPLSTEIPWDRIQKVRVSRDGSAYSFEFEIAGKKQLFTVKTTPGQTEFTLSQPDGVPIVHATQKGREIKVIDFSEKLSLKTARPVKKGKK